MDIQRPSATVQSSKKDRLEKKVYRNENGEPHRLDGPAVIFFYAGSSTVFREEWRVKGALHRKGEPAVIEYSRTGRITKQLWFFKNVQHRTDGPAEIFYRSNNTPEKGYWWVQGYHINVNQAEPNVLGFDDKGNISVERWISDNGNADLRGRFPVAVFYNENGETTAEEWHPASKIVQNYDHPVKIGYHSSSNNINYILYAKKEDFYGDRILEISFYDCGEMKKTIYQTGGGLMPSSLREETGRCTCFDRPQESVKTEESADFINNILR